MTKEEILAYFSKDIYATETTGIEVLEVGDSYAKTKLDIKHGHRNADGVVMGGCIYTLADFTFAIAANSVDISTKTLSSNIIFNSPATGDVLYADTQIVKNGRTICTYEVRVVDENDRLIATVVCMGFRKN